MSFSFFGPTFLNICEHIQLKVELQLPALAALSGDFCELGSTFVLEWLIPGET